MDWKACPPAIEIAAAVLSSAGLGGAICFAVARIAPFGAGLSEAGIAGACAALAGGYLIARVDRHSYAGKRRAALESLGAVAVGDDVLMLGQGDEGDVLLLDDPLAADAESRVIRLFAAPSGGGEAQHAPAAPGEMITRIENFLGHARGGADGAPNSAAGEAASSDANAALHAALADIRRSLRQG